jgi:protein-L-isoaspartate(D-aspartate) O-methyltransferase
MSSYPRNEERLRMVERQIEARGIHNFGVLSAMREIPRHIFVPPPYDKSAYDDKPLPIGSGQTISQPYIVALMTALIHPDLSDNVLEIGTGSGYQAAVLARLVHRLTTMERIPAVAILARNNLKSLRVQNVEVIEGDGTHGYLQNAPYNGIMVTAATPEIPKTLTDQLADGGRLVAPVGGRDVQELVTLEKKRDLIIPQYHGGVRFVPLIGTYGWEN